MEVCSRRQEPRRRNFTGRWTCLPAKRTGHSISHKGSNECAPIAAEHCQRTPDTPWLAKLVEAATDYTLAVTAVCDSMVSLLSNCRDLVDTAFQNYHR